MSGPGELLFEQPSKDTLRLVLTGSWKLGEALPSAEDVRKKIESTGPIRSISFHAEKLGDWDSGLLTFLLKLWKLCSSSNISVDGTGLPIGARQIMSLAVAVPEEKSARKAEGKLTFLVHLGNQTVAFYRSCSELLEFVGETTVAFMKLLRGKAQYRRADLGLLLLAAFGRR
jgi:phospholipid/cholesterol/gamma-HCH transport system permease protein